MMKPYLIIHIILEESVEREVKSSVDLSRRNGYCSSIEPTWRLDQRPTCFPIPRPAVEFVASNYIKDGVELSQLATMESCLPLDLLSQCEPLHLTQQKPAAVYWFDMGLREGYNCYCEPISSKVLTYSRYSNNTLIAVYITYYFHI